MFPSACPAPPVPSAAMHIPAPRLFGPVRSPSAPLPLSSLAALSSSAPSARSLVPTPTDSAAVLGSFDSLSACMPPSPSLEARRRSVPASSSSLLPSAGRHHFYFAIGSMCNPVSLLLRGIQPVAGCSIAGLLRGYRLVFHGEAGMANIQRVDGVAETALQDSEYEEHFHGVLHLISDAHLALLDRIEAGYGRIVANVELYDGSTQAAFVYQMHDTTQTQHGLPSERYLDIISRGCQHYNVCSRYVQWLRALPCVPRPQPSQLLSLPVPVPCRPFTPSELAACDGEDGRKLCIAVNGKVLQYVGEADDSDSSSFCPTKSSAYARVKADYAGRDVTYLLALTCYEPLFPVASCAAQLSQQHKLRIEDMYARKLACLACFSFEVVGTLVDEPEQPQSTDDSVHILVTDTTVPPTSPRATALDSSFLDGRCIGEFKARRRRGSLTSAILENVQRIIQLQSQAGVPLADAVNDAEVLNGDDLMQPAADLVGVAACDGKSMSRSLMCAGADISSTVETLPGYSDSDDGHSPLQSPVSPLEDERLRRHSAFGERLQTALMAE